VVGLPTGPLAWGKRRERTAAKRAGYQVEVSSARTWKSRMYMIRGRDVEGVGSADSWGEGRLTSSSKNGFILDAEGEVSRGEEGEGERGLIDAPESFRPVGIEIEREGIIMGVLSSSSMD